MLALFKACFYRLSSAGTKRSKSDTKETVSLCCYRYSCQYGLWYLFSNRYRYPYTLAFTLVIRCVIVCVCEVIFSEQTLSGEFGATVITEMSTEGWKHSCHFLRSPEWVCVLCVFLSAWSVGEGVCPYCVMPGHTPWLVKTQWQVVTHVTEEEMMLWWSSVCVCVCAFLLYDPAGLSAATRPCDVGCLCLYGTAYSLVSSEDDTPNKMCPGLCKF